MSAPKFGIIVAAYECHEGLEERLRPFKRENFYISVVHSCFKEMHEMGASILSNDKTDLLLEQLQAYGLIDYLTVLKQPVESEAAARNAALNALITRQKIDYIFILDGSDEVFSDKEVLDIVKYVNSKPEIAVFSINYKNYVFSRHQYITDFAPKRIFKMEVFNGKRLTGQGFYFDNDFYYFDPAEKIVKDTELASKRIPRSIAQPQHFSWSDSERSKQKVFYQEQHFKNSGCSYRWNHQLNKLEFNLDFFKRNNLALPTVYEE